MVSVIQLPYDSDGACMLCKAKPGEEETLTCKTCATPWHVACLSSKPETTTETLQWECPDCSAQPSELPPVAAGTALLDASDGSRELVVKIRAIEADATLTDMEKARRRQLLMSGKAVLEEDEESEKDKDKDGEKDVLDLISGTLNCSFCMQLPDRPVTLNLPFARDLIVINVMGTREADVSLTEKKFTTSKSQRFQGSQIFPANHITYHLL